MKRTLLLVALILQLSLSASSNGGAKTSLTVTPVNLSQLYPQYSTADYISIFWSQNTDQDFMNYKLYRATHPNVTTADTLAATLTDQNQVYFKDSPLAPGTYYYRVFVSNQSDELSPGSNELSGSVFAPSEVKEHMPGIPEPGETSFPADVAIPTSVLPVNLFDCPRDETGTCTGGFSAIGVRLDAFGNENKFRFFSSDISNLQLNSQQTLKVYVLADDIVRITLTSQDQDYTVSVPDYGLLANVPQGQTRIMEFQANNPGSFDIVLQGSAGSNSTAGRLNVIKFNAPPAPTTNLSITNVASSATVEVGRIFNYTVTVSNAGPIAADPVAVTDQLPAGMTLTSAATSQGSCSFTTATGTVSCQLGQVAANSSAAVMLQVKARQEGPFSNTATFSAPQFDPAAGSNSATANVTAVKYADILVRNVQSAMTAYVGDTVKYTLTVTNNGLSPATGISLTDALPSGMVFVSAAFTQGNGTLVTPPVDSGGTVTANLSDPMPYRGAAVVLEVTAKATAAGAAVNTASVSANETDPNTANNTTSQTTTVYASATLSKVLLSNQSPVGGCAPYPTGQVYLTAPAPAGGVTINLSSSVSGASVPTTLFVAGGQTISPQFTVMTSPVTSKQVGLITATLDSSSVSRGLTINKGSGVCP
ncbi:MAG TPA: hypothetical protein VGP08_19875 [Pyrinomonadaceae bacterium]|jgi:uncharacterized repeat protein (TIGR01451 family)|nr:hypothetical protein [Pyrinomonadaceae bacterium]